MAVTAYKLFGATDAAEAVDPHAVYRRLRRESPVLPVITQSGQEALLITRYADVDRVLKDDATFSNRSHAKGISLVMGRTIIEMDGREHVRHRSVISPSMAPRSLRGDFPAIVASIAHEIIDGFAGHGTADLVAAFTFNYPLQAFARILGLPPVDYDVFHRWAIDITRIARDPGRGFNASQSLAEYLRPILERRKAEPTDDLMSKLVNAEVDGHRLDEEEVVSFLRLLVIAGAETTYHLIGSALFALLGDEKLLASVRADRTRLDAVVAETLRWESPVQWTTREPTTDVVMSDVAVAAGSELLVAVGSANRDERHFAEPDRFLPDRTERDHLAFGFGRHFCVGARLAQIEAGVALGALLDRLPDLRLDRDAPPPSIVGLAFRGPDHLHVRFDS